MAVPIFEHPHRPHFFDSVRSRLLYHYGISGKHLACPKIVYIDRQDTKRRMPDELHAEFLDMMRDMETEGYGQFEHISLEDISPLQQLREVADASVSTTGIAG